MKKIILSLFILATVLFSNVATISAETSVQSQLDAINSLSKEIENLQAQRDNKIIELFKQLSQGAKNDKNKNKELRKLCSVLSPKWFNKHDEKNSKISDCKKIFKGKKDILNWGNWDWKKPTPDTNDTTAPTISAVNSSNISTTSAKINWNTNEYANSTVWYSTTNPVTTGSSTKKEKSNFVKEHSITLSDLSANTTYYYIVGGKDASGNESKSAQGTFTTLASNADTTGPVISELLITNITKTEAEIRWKTNEDAKDKIWYGTSSPVSTSGSPAIMNNSFDDSHEFELSGLTAGTTYYFIISSTDNSNNTSSSVQGSFTTSS